MNTETQLTSASPPRYPRCRINRFMRMLFPVALLPGNVLATESGPVLLDFTGQWQGLLCLALFTLAYLLVAGEEPLRLKKSKPMLMAGALIWVLVAVAYNGAGESHSAETIFRTSIEHFSELFLFLLASMTYVNAMTERGIFGSLRQWLIARDYSLRKIYWITGLMTFALSPLIANLAIALLMINIVLTVAPGNRAFIVASATSIVVAANAGGVFSPFGDITTLMVWQRGELEYHQFLLLLLPALSCWILPALVMSFSITHEKPTAGSSDVHLHEGAWVIVSLFAFTLFMALCFESILHLPAVLGMMTGLGLLKLYGYRLKRRGVSHLSSTTNPGVERQFDIFRSLERSEWDTLMFMLGVVASVSGLFAMGYLTLSAEVLYGTLGPTAANITLGMFSAIVENVAVMYAILGMQPDMNQAQWLLVTLAAGAGGSLLSIGSAAGVAVMGQARESYTFMAHLRWTWAVAIGYAVGIWIHLTLSSGGA